MQDTTNAAGQVRTYDESDGKPVTFDAAVSIWALAAREALLETAADYHAVLTYPALGERVQSETGVRTTKSVFQWVDEVLARVTAECAARDEPLLSALCVRADGSVGPGYARAVVAATGHRPTDPDEHAAVERLRCHQQFGADIPPGGGEPSRPRTTLVRAATRSRVAGSAARSPRAEGSSTTRPTRTATARPAKRIPGEHASAVSAPVSQPRASTTAAPPAPAVCPTCFTQLPATGRCDNCD
ncbi:hypothetical protein [Cellulomonas edaphi]|uniref:DUF222 domain-containing protein n=1 Tax=Cellulomonas edaphi TaxID=3053468 RepID=A0ABT7S3W1_9CELL|nr:hypothetical protein [Cellulomons edaphi]MDM7830311.1 hypothetical protein [Cellulomons edaphi]